MTSEATETLLDRDAELAALRRTLDDARERRGRLVIVEGEAGIGKTALLGLLQHVSEPATAITELARVLRPGGRIVIAEPDWSHLRVLACPHGLADDIATRLRARTRQPELARSLTGLLRAGGLCAVREHRLPLVIRDGEMARRIVARSGIGARAQREWRDRTHELPQQGLALVTIPAIAVTARKPPGGE